LLVLGAVAVIAAWHYFLGPMLGFGGGGDDGAARIAATRRAVDSEGDEVAKPGRRAAAERHGAHPGDRVAVLRMADLDRAPRPAGGRGDTVRSVAPAAP